MSTETDTIARPGSDRMVTVGISEMRVETDTSLTLVTYSLGSCLGLTIYEPNVPVGGIIHCMLPLSKIDRNKASARPYMFVDTGVTALLNAMFQKGARKENMIVNAAGCGSPLGEESSFKIGQRNHTVLRKLLWKNRLLIEGECVGGSNAKTLFLSMQTGQTMVKMAGKKIVL